MFKIYNEDCVSPINLISDNSVDLGIFDPPFGLGESSFGKHYKRDSSQIIKGYIEAPKNYSEWTYEWLKEAKRVLKPEGTMYVFMGNSNLRSLLNAAHELGLYELNHLIWKYNFGVFTRNKYVTSHYHILYYSKKRNVKKTFNTYCRFGFGEKSKGGSSLLYRDLEDVFVINKDYHPKKKKNQNKLPEELINKLILYSSKENDLICDFFLGNFTTAYCALKLGRNICGYEINKNVYDYHIEKLKDVNFGENLKYLKKIKNSVPLNQGKKLTSEELNFIYSDYLHMLKNGQKKKDISSFLQEKYQRGRFSIKNILDKMEKQDSV